MAPRPAGQEHFERADWKKIVFALADYAYRGLGPEATWSEARTLVRATISLALDPEKEDWDPREETLIMHLGAILREVILVVRDERGTGREAREASPDWALAARTYSTDEIRKRLVGAAGLPIPNDDYFRARRRLRRKAVDVIHELVAEKP